MKRRNDSRTQERVEEAQPEKAVHPSESNTQNRQDHVEALREEGNQQQPQDSLASALAQPARPDDPQGVKAKAPPLGTTVEPTTGRGGKRPTRPRRPRKRRIRAARARARRSRRKS